MKRFFTYVGSLFKNSNYPVIAEIEEKENQGKVVLDSRELTDNFYDFEPESLTYKQKVLAVIELHSASFDNKAFTTAMVYNWLRGEISILAIRKAIYKLHGSGVLECCKKTFSNNKKVKFYYLKNEKNMFFYYIKSK